MTSPGPFTRTTKDTGNSIVPPIPLWSRGNPDTQDGTAGGTLNNDAADSAAYRAMGETWSAPSVSFVDALPSARKPCTGGGADTAGNACVTPNGSGVSFAMFMGSGYGDVGEGTTLFTLDALTGDVVATADVGSRSPAPVEVVDGQPGQPYANAIVASPSLYQSGVFRRKFATHPSGTKATRLYVGDLHGRLWKVLPRHPSQAILFADLGKDQPVATGASLGCWPYDSSGQCTGTPHIYVTTGNDQRAEPDTTAGGTGSFLNAGFVDDVASDDDLTPTAVPSIAGCAVLSPVLPCLFTQPFLDENGNPGLFRGTVQPAVVLNQNEQLRVFFGGTLFVPPPPALRGTPGPSTPGGDINANCTSRFDSEVFALAGVGGEAGIDVTGQPGAAQGYVVWTKARIGSLTIEQDPSTFGASLRVGETIRAGSGGPGGGLPPPPPPGGAKPTAGQTVTSRGGMLMSSGVCRQ